MNKEEMKNKNEGFAFAEPQLSLTMEKSIETNEYVMRFEITNYEELRDFEDVHSLYQLKILEHYDSDENEVEKWENKNQVLCDCISSRNLFLICKQIAEYLSLFSINTVSLSTLEFYKDNDEDNKTVKKTIDFFDELFKNKGFIFVEKEHTILSQLRAYIINVYLELVIGDLYFNDDFKYYDLREFDISLTKNQLRINWKKVIDHFDELLKSIDEEISEIKRSIEF